MTTTNNFKKFLINEVRCKSFADMKQIIDEVEEYSNTNSFQMAYEQWRCVDRFHEIKDQRPYMNRIKDVLEK